MLDIQFNPYATGTLVTCGVKHIKFWSHCGNMLTGKKGIFGTAGISIITPIVFCNTLGFNTGELQSILCVSFGSAEITYAGTFSGDVYKWNENRLQTVIGAHSVSLYLLACMQT